MKRTSIEFMIGWLDALRRDDVDTLKATLEPDVVWHGLREEWSCHGAEEVIDTFAGQRDAMSEIDVIELRYPPTVTVTRHRRRPKAPLRRGFRASRASDRPQ